MPCFSLFLCIFLHTHTCTHIFWTSWVTCINYVPLLPSTSLCIFLEQAFCFTPTGEWSCQKITHSHNTRSSPHNVLYINFFPNPGSNPGSLTAFRCCVLSVISNVKHFLNFCFSRHGHVLSAWAICFGNFPTNFLSCLTGVPYMRYCVLSTSYQEVHDVSLPHNWRC